MKYIINGFTPKMLRKNTDAKIKVEPMFELELEMELEKDDCISAVGHYNLAEHLGVERNRMNIILEKGDVAYLIESRKINKEIKYDYKRITII